MVCVIFVNMPLLYLSQISFVRQRDFRLLSNGHSLFTTDRRFEIVHRAKTIDWILRLKRVQLSDSGAYMCQVSGMRYGASINDIHKKLDFFTPSPLSAFGTDFYDIINATFLIKSAFP